MNFIVTVIFVVVTLNATNDENIHHKFNDLKSSSKTNNIHDIKLPSYGAFRIRNRL